ncbi:MAG: nucleotidyltransferase domain-containing protein [Pseudomonadota bacterium]
MPGETRSTMRSPVVLSLSQALTVRRIIDSVVADAEVKVFGSRATGRARPFSDLDLLFVRPPHLTWQQRADLRDRFEASELPFRVDLVEVCALPPGMAERVASESVQLPRA